MDGYGVGLEGVARTVPGAGQSPREVHRSMVPGKAAENPLATHLGEPVLAVERRRPDHAATPPSVPSIPVSVAGPASGSSSGRRSTRHDSAAGLLLALGMGASGGTGPIAAEEEAGSPAGSRPTSSSS